MNAHELKQLQVRKTKLEVELVSLKEDVRIAQQKQSDAQRQLNSIVDQIKSSSDDVVLSEHAMLRYFERAMGFDLEDVRKSILTDQVKKAVSTISSGKLPIGNGFFAVVKNKTIVTIE